MTTNPALTSSPSVAGSTRGGSARSSARRSSRSDTRAALLRHTYGCAIQAAPGQSCDCPGAEEKRQRLNDAGIEPLDFGEIRAEAARRSRARREAFQAARLASAGKSTTEIQDLYAAELRARGLRIPREEVLAAAADRIRRNPLPSYKLAGEGLVQIGKATVKIARLFRDITKPPA